MFKGLKMAGRMGHVKTTTLSLVVHKVDTERGLLLIKGVPGPKGGLLLVRSAVKGGPVGSDKEVTLSSTETRTDRQVDVRTPAGETSGSVTLR